MFRPHFAPSRQSVKVSGIFDNPLELFIDSALMLVQGIAFTSFHPFVHKYLSNQSCITQLQLQEVSQIFMRVE